MKHDPMEKLCRILEDELQAHQESLDFAQTQQEALIRQDMDALKRILDKEDEIVDRLRAAESARARVIHEVRHAMKLKQDHATLRNVLTHVAGEWEARLQDVRGKLIRVIEELARVNRTNALLVKQAIDHIHGFVSILFQGKYASSGLYTANGTLQTDGPRYLLNQRI